MISYRSPLVGVGVGFPGKGRHGESFTAVAGVRPRALQREDGTATILVDVALLLQ